MVKRRGAFDIGSGATKLQVSDVTAGGVLVKTLFGEERPCAFGADWLKSSDGCLSAEIQEKGIQTIKDLKVIGDDLGVESYAVIATEVFRKAVNGHLFLDKVRSMGISVTVISQEIEAELGYATAAAYNDQGSCGCIAWDSGGGSFQISTLALDSSTTGNVLASSLNTQKLSMYMGCIGSGVATATLVETLQGRKLSEVLTPNPVSIADAKRLIEALTNKIDPNVPSWLKNAPEVVAIGGPNSIFQLACSVLTIMRNPANSGDAIDDDLKVSSFNLADINLAIEECVDRSDDYLQKYLLYPNADPVTIVVPKLCLLYSVMKHTGMKHVKAVNCIGSCGGILTTERFYSI